MKMTRAILILMTAIASLAANAEMISPNVIKSILEEIGLSRMHTVRDGLSRSMRIFSEQTKKTLGHDALLTEHYVMLPGSAKESSSVVLRVVPKDTHVLGLVAGRRPDYKSKGELEIGIFEILKGKDHQAIKDVVARNGERRFLDRRFVGEQQQMAGEIMALDNGRMEDEIAKLVISMSVDETAVIKAFPKFVKVDDGVYATVRGVRINTENLSAQQVQAIIASLSDFARLGIL